MLESIFIVMTIRFLWIYWWPTRHVARFSFNVDVRINDGWRIPFVTKNVIEQVLITSANRNRFIQVGIGFELERESFQFDIESNLK